MLEGVGADGSGADPGHVVNRYNPEDPVTDVPGSCGRHDGAHHGLYLIVADQDFDPHLGNEINRELGPTSVWPR